MIFDKMTRHGVLAALCALASAASAASSGTTPDGWAYVSGGVGDEESQRMRADRAHFSAWVVTVARASGAYLADARVRIRDASDRTVFDQALDGPWLMINLPPGRYAIEASYRDHSERQTLSLEAGAHRQLIFHFDVPAGGGAADSTSH